MTDLSVLQLYLLEKHSEFKEKFKMAYLMHFNPNHDPKTGQFTFSKYLTRDGRLSDYTLSRRGFRWA